MITVIHLRSWKEEGQTKLSKKMAREILKIQRRDRFNEHCKALGLFKQRSYTYPDLAEILGMDLYLRAGYGKHSRQQYMKLKRQPQLLKLELQRLDISVENELKRLLNGNHATTTL